MKKTTLLLLPVLGFLHASAQKLPQVQQASLRAPANVKIDGKNTEWGKMKALNNATDMLYTMSNDDKKLYLIIQSKDKNHVKLVEGITFIVQPTGQRDEKGARLLKYPYLGKQTGLVGQFPLTPFSYNADGTITNMKDPDGTLTQELIKKSNTGLRSLCKWIYTRGFFGKDSIISVYNEEGIEAANGFGSDKIYTSELSVDLKILGLSIDKSKRFSYHILVNGEPVKYRNVNLADVRESFKPSPGMTQAEIDGAVEKLTAAYSRSSATYDFWGEYTLAK